MTGASLPKVPFEQEIEVGEGVSHTGTRGWVFQAAGQGGKGLEVRDPWACHRKCREYEFVINDTV